MRWKVIGYIVVSMFGYRDALSPDNDDELAVVDG